MHTIAVAWSGEVDYARAAALAAQLHRAIDEAGAGRVVVDLSAVTFFDCAGITTLATAHARCLERDVSLALQGVPERVATILRLTRVDTLFPVLPDLDPAGL